MTCEEFNRITQTTLPFDVTAAERSAACKHFASCESCHVALEESALAKQGQLTEFLKKIGSSEEELQKAIKAQCILDSLDSEA